MLSIVCIYLFIYHYLFKCFFFVSERFLYTCKFEFENYSGIELLELLIATDELGLESLYECMMKYFIENCGEYIKENVVEILQTIYKSVPYQMLFPKDLRDNVLQYYLVPSRQQTLNLLPSRKSKIESTYSRLESTTIINQKLILLFASWIDKKSLPYSSPGEVKYE